MNYFDEPIKSSIFYRDYHSFFNREAMQFFCALEEIYGEGTLRIKLGNKEHKGHSQLNVIYFKKMGFLKKMPVLRIMVRVLINKRNKGDPGIWMQINENAPQKDELVALARNNISNFFMAVADQSKGFSTNISEVDMEPSIFGVQLEFA